MPYEVECGECQKQILIEEIGVEVSCPYCDTTLILTKEDLADREETLSTGDSHVVMSEEVEATSFDFHYSENSSSILANGESGDSHLSGSGVSSAILDEEPPESASSDEDESDEEVRDFNFTKSPSEDPTLDSDEPETREDIPNFDFTDSPQAGTARPEPTSTSADTSDAADTSDVELPNFNFGDPEDSGSSDVPVISIDTAAAAPRETSRTKAPVEKAKKKTQKQQPEGDEQAPVTAGSYARRNQGISPPVLYSLISYSILMTIAFLYLLMSFYTAKPHQLESLPDLAPPEEGEFHLIRENAILAPGHTLQIGESQRFGSIQVTPLKVTRAPLQFDHFQNKRLGPGLPPTRPVLKLWLQIENVSRDQVFPPLDLEMLTKRDHDKENYDLIHAHNWVCREEDLSDLTGRVLMYNHPPTLEYDIRGLVTKPLKPGETVKTFLPTQEEDLGRLTGSLVWRFQIRKGFNPYTKNGVTTLVEVEFSSNDIQTDSI